MSVDECENYGSAMYSGSAKVDQVLVNMNAIDNNQNNNQHLSKSQVEHVHDMMEEAMKDTNGIHPNGKSSKYLFFIVALCILITLKFLSPTNAPLYYTYKMLKYTVKISHDCSYMFRSTWTIFREPMLNLAKVTILWR
jgi:hypothetical protein